MATAAVTNTFVDATTIEAADENQNFTDLVTFINTHCIQKDGSLAMTSPLTLSGNPTTALQAAPKQYVDAGAAGVVGFRSTGAFYNYVANGTETTVSALTHSVDLEDGYYYTATLTMPVMTLGSGSGRITGRLYKDGAEVQKFFADQTDDGNSGHLEYTWLQSGDDTQTFLVKVAHNAGITTSINGSAASPAQLRIERKANL